MILSAAIEESAYIILNAAHTIFSDKLQQMFRWAGYRPSANATPILGTPNGDGNLDADQGPAGGYGQHGFIDARFIAAGHPRLTRHARRVLQTRRSKDSRTSFRQANNTYEKNLKQKMF